MSPTLRAAFRPEPAVDPGDTRRCRGDRGYVTDVPLPVVLAVGVLIVVVTVFAIRLAYGSADDGIKPRALILGDSITDHGQRELNDTGHHSMIIAGRLQDTFRIDDQLPVAGRWAPRSFQQVVINLGTNDAVQGWPQDQSSANLTKLVGMFPNAACLHLTTINEHLRGRSSEAGPSATALNDQIRAMAAADPRISIVDWNALVEANSAEGVDLTSDGVHPTREGGQLLINAYDMSMDSCQRS